MLPAFFRANVRRMRGYVPGEQPDSAEILKLNTNENPYPPSPRVARVLAEFPVHALRLYPDPLATAARQAIAEQFGVEPDWVLCGNGSDDLLTIVTRAFVDQGGTIISFQPGYLLYETLADIQGARFRAVPFTEEWGIPPEPALYDGADLLFLANPNSPSGTVVSREVIAELAAKVSCPLVVDEAYADFAETSCADLVREYENLIVVRTLSKSYSLAGIRFGYLIAQPPVVHGLIRVKDSYNCDALSIAVAEAAVRDPKHMQENVRRIQRTRRRVRDALAALGFPSPDSRANFLWCTSGPVDPRTLHAGLRAQGILVRLLDYKSYGVGVRITIGTDEQMDRFLHAVRTIVNGGAPS